MLIDFNICRIDNVYSNILFDTGATVSVFPLFLESIKVDKKISHLGHNSSQIKINKEINEAI